MTVPIAGWNSVPEREAMNSFREWLEFENTYVWKLMHNVILKNQVENHSKIDDYVNNQKSKIYKSNFSQMAYGYQGTEWKQAIQIICVGYLQKIQ